MPDVQPWSAEAPKASRPLRQPRQDPVLYTLTLELLSSTGESLQVELVKLGFRHSIGTVLVPKPAENQRDGIEMARNPSQLDMFSS